MNNKIYKFLFIFLIGIFFIGFASATFCYQETANVSTACGGLATGNYANSSDGYYGRALVNYSKPSGAFNSSLWQVKYGENITANLTINSTCWNAYSDKLVLRMSSHTNDLGSCAANSYAECYNGSSWIILASQITSLPSGFCAPSSYAPISNFYDGDWNTGLSWVGSWQTISYEKSAIYEEAMNWDFDIVSPNISLISPANSTSTSNKNINFTANISDDFGINNASLYIFNTTTSLCYQETANVSTACGGLSDGSYLISDLFFINYTKPVGALSNSLWELNIAQGGIRNHTIPNSCWNAYANKLSLKTNGNYGYCFNGTDWEDITGYIGPSGGDEGMPACDTYNLLDGNWSSGCMYNYGQWSVVQGGNDIYEEAMIWNISYIVNKTTVSYSPGVLQTTLGIVVALTNNVYTWLYETIDNTGNRALSEIRSLTLTDSCSYSGTGDWNVQCSDMCNITTQKNIQGNLILNNSAGNGTLFVSSVINFNATNQKIKVYSGCNIKIYSGGKMK